MVAGYYYCQVWPDALCKYSMYYNMLTNMCSHGMNRIPDHLRFLLCFYYTESSSQEENLVSSFVAIVGWLKGLIVTKSTKAPNFCSS